MVALVLTFFGCRAAWRSPVRTALTTLLVFVVLVPDTLAIPGPFVSYLPVRRLVLLALALRLLRDAGRGELWRADLRPTRVHLAFAAHLAVVVLAGFALAPPGLRVQPGVVAFFGLAEQVLLFTVVLVECRVIDDPPAVVRAFSVVVAISVVIAGLERVTHQSWAALLLGNGSGLELRGGEVRVRAGAQFALAFAWITAMVMPIVITHFAHVRRLRWIAVGALAAMTIVWSGSRSALPAIGVGVLVLVVASRFEKRFVLVAIVGGLLGVAALAGVEGVTRAYSTRDATGSDETRSTRFATVTNAAAARPTTGLGMASVSTRLGQYGTDASYLLAYVETGVVGLTTLSVLLLTALLCTAGGLRAPPGSDRRVAAACTAGVMLGIIGACAFDLFSVPGSALTFWSVCAIGVAVADRTRSLDLVAARPSPYRALLPVAGLALGVLVATTAPRHAAVTYRFDTIPVAADVYAGGDLAHYGTITARSACEHVRHLDLAPGVTERCSVIDQSGGLGILRVQAPEANGASAFGEAIVARVTAAHPGFHAVAVGPPVSGRPSAARTAPVWLGLGGLLLALLLPPPPVPRAAGDRRRLGPVPQRA
jgi:hypothetical protein